MKQLSVLLFQLDTLTLKQGEHLKKSQADVAQKYEEQISTLKDNVSVLLNTFL